MSKTVILGIIIAALSGLKLVLPVAWHPVIDALIGALAGGAVVTARMAIGKASRGEEV